MNAETLLAELSRKGVACTHTGIKLRFTARNGVLTAEDKQQIMAEQPGLTELLLPPQPAGNIPASNGQDRLLGIFASCLEGMAVDPLEVLDAGPFIEDDLRAIAAGEMTKAGIRQCVASWICAGKSVSDYDPWLLGIDELQDRRAEWVLPNT